MPLLTNEMMSTESLTDATHPFLKERFVTSQCGIETGYGTFSNGDISAMPLNTLVDELMVTMSLKTVSLIQLLCCFVPHCHICDSESIN